MNNQQGPTQFGNMQPQPAEPDPKARSARPRNILAPRAFPGHAVLPGWQQNNTIQEPVGQADYMQQSLQNSPMAPGVIPPDDATLQQPFNYNNGTMPQMDFSRPTSSPLMDQPAGGSQMLKPSMLFNPQPFGEAQSPTQQFATLQLNFNGQQAGAEINNPEAAAPTRNVTGMLGATNALPNTVGDYSGQTGMLTLNQAVKVVKVPVAGQPGQYMTGILPAQPGMGGTGMLPPPAVPQDPSFKGKVKKNSKMIALIGIVLLVIFSSSVYLLTRSSSSSSTTTVADNGNTNNTTSSTNTGANATAQFNATATAMQNNLILEDPLTANIHGWKQAAQNGTDGHFWFQNNTYNISPTNQYMSYTVMWNETTPVNYTYALTMKEVKGDYNSPYNKFGLVFDYNVTNNNFYMFRVTNSHSGGQYEFVRYTDQNSLSSAIWSHKVGSEFHIGNASNTLSVSAQGSKYTFSVNGKQVGSASDSKLKPGEFGMMVAEKGSQVAFTDLKLYNN
ncbi:MAG TPA: hypothetical protein VL461_10695 [Dictyobacter sp.]|jgi:hypothetical protein|nr:hypothetical protein [Dictyobacter sp.]